MINNIKNETEKMIGKVKERAGELMDDNELEFKGKMQTVKGNISDKADDIKDKMYNKANEVMDKINHKRNDD